MDGKDEVLRKPKDMPQTEVPIFVDFLEGMLAVEPDDRKSAAEMLKHPWLDIESRPKSEKVSSLDSEMV